MSISKPVLERNQTAASTMMRVIAIRGVNKGTVRTVVDVGLGASLIIKEFKVIQQPGQKAWVSPPSREWQGTGGKRHFAPLVELMGSLKPRGEQAILGAWAAEEESAHVR